MRMAVVPEQLTSTLSWWRLEKLKLLIYEEEVVAKWNMKSQTRHHFVCSPDLPSNPSEQFIIAAWLINTAGRWFTEEKDEPSPTVSNILAELRALEAAVNFQPSKLKSCSGEFVCLISSYWQIPQPVKTFYIPNKSLSLPDFISEITLHSNSKYKAALPGQHVWDPPTDSQFAGQGTMRDNPKVSTSVCWRRS